MAGIAGKPPVVPKGKPHWNAAKIRSTLRRYYHRRRHAEAESFPDFHDANLRRMFSESRGKGETRRSVTRLLKTYRKPLLIIVSGWTGERRYMVNEVYKAIYQRSKALHLVTEDTEPVVLLELATYITTLMMNYRYTARFRGKKVKV
jgi:hypothetical protein